MRCLALIAAFGLIACQQQAAAPNKAPADATATAALLTGDFVPTGGAEDDSSFRGDLRIEQSSDNPAQYTFKWMEGRHVVVATGGDVADGAAVIDTLEGGAPLTLAAALGAPAGAKIEWLGVTQEEGPIDDADFTPLCGIRAVTDIALYRAPDGGVRLATSFGAFGAPGANGCSNVISYAKKPA